MGGISHGIWKPVAGMGWGGAGKAGATIAFNNGLGTRAAFKRTTEFSFLVFRATLSPPRGGMVLEGGGGGGGTRPVLGLEGLVGVQVGSTHRAQGISPVNPVYRPSVHHNNLGISFH